MMWEFDERTIWTDECVPLMVSYNNGNFQSIFCYFVLLIVIKMRYNMICREDAAFPVGGRGQ